MSEAVTPPVDTPATPAPTDAPPVETPSGLPSDNTTPDYSGFDMSDDLKGKFKDGKLNGRFSSMDDVLAKLKEAEDFKSATISEQTKAQNNQDKVLADLNDEASTIATQQAVVDSLIPEFMSNGMVLTPEMEAKAVEAKIDIRDIKIGAYKLREETNAVYKAAGGKENYDNAHSWAKENLPDAQKILFTRDVDSPISGVSEIAVEWLMDKYDKAVKEGTTTPRIQGQPHHSGIRPYENRRDLYKDKDYIDSPAGRRDPVARKNYQARLRMTPDAVVYGHN